jgi:hypothetical protein
MQMTQNHQSTGFVNEKRKVKQNYVTTRLTTLSNSLALVHWRNA